MVEFKQTDVRLLKAGKIAKHPTRSNGKSYLRAKLYLKDASLIGKNYEMYDLEEVNIEEHFGFVAGKGILLLLPNIPRTKDKIGSYGEHRLFNRYLSKRKKF